MPRSLCILLVLVVAIPSAAQTARGIGKKLDTFWGSKHIRARMLAETMGLRAGDTIADIGTADGWFAAALAAYADGVTFYLEDIDSTVWNRGTFDSAFYHFASKINRTPHHQFYFVRGTETSTRLPPGIFDMVMIIDTYHHFSNRDAMLTDAVGLLRPGGKIIIMEALARKPGDVHHGCRKSIYAEGEIISHLALMGMELEHIRFIHKVAGRKNKLFVFSRT
jgi:ubiquinone/menaquinone biosynthesis C-methylase UbiE